MHPNNKIHQACRSCYIPEDAKSHQITSSYCVPSSDKPADLVKVMLSYAGRAATACLLSPSPQELTFHQVQTLSLRCHFQLCKIYQMSLSEYGQQIIVNIHLKYHFVALAELWYSYVCKNGVKVFWKALLRTGTKAFSQLSSEQMAFSLAFYISKTFYPPHSQETNAYV